MTTLLHGPDGRPLLVAGAQGEVEKTASAQQRFGITETELERRYAEEVGKRVRARQVSMGTVMDRMRGKPKPTPVTFQTLRQMSRRNEWVAAAIKIRQNQIAGVPWDVVLKDQDDASGASARMAKKVRGLLQRPAMHGSRPQSTSWRQFISMWVEDLLVLDGAAIEKERNSQRWILAMYNVDGATIRPNIDDRGGWQDDAYVQEVDGKIEARFGVEDLIYCMDNPQTDVRFFGYGFSPLEKIIVSVTADLHAAKYNAEYFVKGAVPEGLLDLGEDFSPEDVTAFRLYWMHEVMGKPWVLPMVGGSKGVDFKQWRDSNRDMQFMEYQDWLLQKICAVLQISKQELGAIEDVNRSTADQQDEANERKGITPLLALIKDSIDLEIIGEHGQGLGDYLEFSWEQPGESAQAINDKFQPMVQEGAATRQEWRDAHGMGKSEEGAHGSEGLAMHLASGEPKPLPNHEDAMALGASAQQDREDQQTQQAQEHEQQLADKGAIAGDDDQGGDASATPWQPADGNDPGVKQAMTDHDKRSGVGPRNGSVGKRQSRRLGPFATVAKRHPHGHDRNPAMTARQDDLDQVLEPALVKLVDGLAGLLAGDD